MDFIYGILADYYFVFLVVGIILLIALIGFITKAKKKTNKNLGEAPQVESPQPMKAENTSVIATSSETQNQTPQIITEPSLDNLSSTATQVDVGVDTQSPPTSIFEIKDTTPVGTINNETLNQQMNSNTQNITSPQQTNQVVQQPVQTPVNVPDEIDATPVATLVIEDTGKEVGTTIN